MSANALGQIPVMIPTKDGKWKAMSQMSKRKAFTKKYSKIILPHVGLVLLCIIYTVGGATVFFFLERTNEDRIRKEGIARISRTKLELLDTLWDLGELSDDKINKERWKIIANEHIDNLTRILFKAFEDRYISFENIQSNGTNVTTIWTFPAAVFFAASTVTTIGYGRPVPVTEQGRIICVVFGLLGIPLMLVTIADIGKFIGGGMVIVFRNYDYLRRRCRRKFRHSTLDFLEEEGIIHK